MGALAALRKNARQEGATVGGWGGDTGFPGSCQYLLCNVELRLVKASLSHYLRTRAETFVLKGLDQSGLPPMARGGSLLQLKPEMTPLINILMT